MATLCITSAWHAAADTSTCHREAPSADAGMIKISISRTCTRVGGRGLSRQHAAARHALGEQQSHEQQTSWDASEPCDLITLVLVFSSTGSTYTPPCVTRPMISTGDARSDQYRCSTSLLLAPTKPAHSAEAEWSAEAERELHRCLPNLIN